MKNIRFFLVFILVAFLSFAAMAQSPWIQQTSNGLIGAFNPSVAFSAVDENVCWGINTINNQYLRTTNGGTNWTVSTITGATGTTGSSITALDANTAWATTTGGIFKTTDGGLTWAQQLTALPSNVIHFFDSNNGVCIGDPAGGYWQIYTTTNGGTNWTRVPSINIPPPLSSEDGIEGNEATSVGNSLWFSTFSGGLYRTTDRGMTWSVTRNIIGDWGFGFAFKDSLNGLACTFGTSDNQYISRTSNGGVTWTPILPIPAGLSGLTTYYIAYVKGTSGSYVITSNNNTGGPVAAIPGSAYSNDNGTTWTYVNNTPLGSASFASWNVGWSAGLNTSIYKWVGLPTAIPTASLQLWLKADEGVTLNGSTVSSWIDQSGNGNNALQSTTNRQPLLVNNALNDKPVLHFDGINDRLGLTGSTTMSQISLFLVFKIDSGLVGNNGTDPFPYHPILFGNFNIGAFGLGMRNYIVGNSPNLIDVFAGGDIYARAEASNIAAFDQWKVVSVVTNHTIWNTTFRSNGVDATITPSSINMSLSVPIGTPNGTSGIGGADDVPAGHFTFKGDIAEVIVYDTVLSASERLAVENYLADKYNIILPVVPVELISFNSSIYGNSIQLTWQTATEKNNKGFEIFRNGKKISFIDGKGTTTEKQNYSFRDEGLSEGLYNYRLNQIDYDGTQEVVGETTINLILPEQFSLEQNYPNPFNPTTTIGYVLQEKSNTKLTLMNIIGEEVAILVNEEQDKGYHKVDLNARNLPSGVYLYKLQSGSFVETKKMMLLK